MSNVYVVPSGRLVVTRNNAKSIRSMRAPSLIGYHDEAH